MDRSVSLRCLLPAALALVLLLGSGAVLASQTPAEPDDAEDHTEDPAVTPPQIILVTQKAPEYPPAALAGRFSGSVKVKVWVAEDGVVRKAEPIESDHPNLGFEEASVAAVKQWRFEPALKDGQPVEYVTTIRLNFRTEGTGRDRKAYVSAGTATTSEPRAQDPSFSRDTRLSTTPPAPPSGRRGP